MADAVDQRKLFGTDGIRGVANYEPITTETVTRLGRACGYFFRSADNRRHKVLVGKDTRLSGYMLEMALVSGICSMGCDAIMTGPLPTPGIAFLTRNMRADAGAVISASHNPFQDNGIKFFSRTGFKLPDADEARIEQLMNSDDLDANRPTGTDIGRAWRIDDAVGRYVVFCKSTFPNDLTLDGIKIVLDTANGAAYRCAPEVFGELGATLIQIGDRPNGSNINEGCGSQTPEAMQRAVLEHGADIGIALDGDADRCIIADEKGQIIDGDALLAICALDMKSKGTLAGNTLVVTVMSNFGLELKMKSEGIDIIRTDVGDRYVVEQMVAGGYNLGGEQSGHIIFLDHITTGDGIISALQALSIMLKTEKPMSELGRVIDPTPQILINVPVAEKVPFDQQPEISAALAKIEEELSGAGRVLLRYSGTENKARVMIEGPDQARVDEMAQDLADLIQQKLGAA